MQRMNSEQPGTKIRAPEPESTREEVGQLGGYYFHPQETAKGPGVIMILDKPPPQPQFPSLKNGATNTYCAGLS